ncbi:uncharacterized protein SETTUDRAFT_163678 [Exserohilum turcica Et28A]|uniref:Uncharacterized protein n=1 Tax=Exserohilum turcicum (strain 28A) TaxID=671987 RepID=R0IIU6_EXST2|nr:uncharacterized protein SETTUDRAFT_163678 [Exserohilum turcica Et28A]EOA84866.1 hypothetical protein SETTUDRAFT_163678 [Exserohilum turcica Et28A]
MAIARACSPALPLAAHGRPSSTALRPQSQLFAIARQFAPPNLLCRHELSPRSTSFLLRPIGMATTQHCPEVSWIACRPRSRGRHPAQSK